ncbi:MAG: hypothetical protein DRP85_04910, partial [Candidatus Makaraimicrobium thalassicum]
VRLIPYRTLKGPESLVSAEGGFSGPFLSPIPRWRESDVPGRDKPDSLTRRKHLLSAELVKKSE